MTTLSRATVLSAALVTTLALACVVAGAGIADAAPLPRSVPMAAAFEGLDVGRSASKSWTLDIPRPAVITDSSIQRDGDDVAFQWRADLCPSVGGACVDLLRSPDGAKLAAGSYVLDLGVTMVAFGAGQSQSIEGRLTFAERPPSSLAFTGADSLVPLLLLAAASLAVGLLLFLTARLRRADRDREFPE